MNVINKTIYYCWFGKEKPQKVLKCIENWKEKLPDYQIVEINEHNKELFDIEKELKNNLWFRTVWENKMWAYVADYARLKVLYERGGVYFDTDITVEKDITELLEKNKLILGWEDKKSINIAVGVVVVVGNPLIKEMLEFYNDEIWHSNLYTIPQIVTYILRKHYSLESSVKITENNDIIVFPPEYFYPMPINCNEPKGYITPNTYTIHWWDGSWAKENIRYFLENKHKIPLEKLLNQVFKENTIYENLCIKINKKYHIYLLSLNLDYLFRFRSKYYNGQKFLTIIILGFQIKLWKMINE